MQYYLYIKSLHLIFVVTWFAGLFYIPRLFVYQIEANSKPENERNICLLYTSPSPRDGATSRMPSSA